MSDTVLSIRSIQHYLYCPHRWGLLEIDKAWAENIFVTKANIMHERVHAPERMYQAKGRKTYSAVSVYNDEPQYDLYGVIDCLEVKAGEREMTIVEYKPTKPKNAEFRYDDLMQVFAQKICVDHVFGGDCEAYLYFADVKKRVKLPLKENYAQYDGHLKALLSEMRYYLRNGIIPPSVKGQNCSGCSLKDICLPLVGKRKSVYSEIKELAKK